MLEPQLIKIPRGKCFVGSTPGQIEDLLKRFPEIEKKLLEREVPQHEIYIADYFIGKYPVTNKEFEEFIDDTSYMTTAEKEGTGNVFAPKFSTITGADWKHPMGPE
ncbi:MAG: formylglycine-generating enzyme family protein [Patescibacteria group bacterium]|nr:formylglycine-generating enzyme family protein [Patescibacteria group bacterium]